MMHKWKENSIDYICINCGLMMWTDPTIELFQFVSFLFFDTCGNRLFKEILPY